LNRIVYENVIVTITIIVTWILHESEAFICKALEGEAIVHYCEPLIKQQMEASGSPVG
jgi:hypothetical protein